MKVYKTNPSGKGLKVMVKTTSTSDTYKFTEEKVAAMFLEATGSPRDNHCKDIARIQFISHDPDLYYNIDSEIVEKSENTEHENLSRVRLHKHGAFLARHLHEQRHDQKNLPLQGY